MHARRRYAPKKLTTHELDAAESLLGVVRSAERRQLLLDYLIAGSAKESCSYENTPRERRKPAGKT